MPEFELVTWPHELYGGWLCLDFANTLDARGMDEHEETLHGYADLVRWGAYAGVLSAEERARLLRRAARATSDASAAHEQALKFREAVYRAFSGVAAGRDLAAEDLDALHRAYAESIAHASLQRDADRLGWSWPAGEFGRAWWPIAVSAIQLLTTGPLERIKVCASDEGCAGLFLDLSKNRSRRWCSMESCGVESKIKQQNARRRAARKRD
ncbi:MAG: ABATE domain-containing protein [Actinomycetota bacterium]